jgi:hypothetical protein
MRGNDAAAGSLFSYVDIEKRVRADDPLRAIREIVNATLGAVSAAFDALYSPFGRESIPPERLLRALLLQAFYTIRSERQLVERIAFDLLFRCAARQARRRQGLRHAGLRRRDARDQHHPARGPKRQRPAIDGRTTRHPGYAISLRIRKRIEEAFGWAKTVAGLRGFMVEGSTSIRSPLIRPCSARRASTQVKTWSWTSSGKRLHVRLSQECSGTCSRSPDRRNSRNGTLLAHRHCRPRSLSMPSK